MGYRDLSLEPCAMQLKPMGRLDWGVVAGLFILCVAACERREQRPQQPTPPKSSILEGGTERPSELVLGLTPFLSEAQMRREFVPVAKYLGSKIGISVSVRTASSYADLAKLLFAREVDLAVLSPLAYVKARRTNPNLVLLLTQIADGSPTYAAYIVTRDDAGMRTVHDLKGKRFAFVDRQSASGYLYALAHLKKAGIEPHSHFASVVFAGNHGKVVDMVLNGEADAGATYSTAVKIARVERPDSERLKILAKTGRIPFDAYCASPSLQQSLIEEIRAALLNLSTRTEEGRRVLRGVTAINGFVQVRDDHYDEVRRVARFLEDPQ